MDNSNKILEVQNLKQYFKIGPKTMNKAVDDISFDVYKGEVFGIVGESGCGKTTTGRSIIRLYEPSAGYVRFKNQTISAGLLDIKTNIANARKNMTNEIKALDKNTVNYNDEKAKIVNKYVNIIDDLRKELEKAKQVVVTKVGEQEIPF
mgnify:CR=1 FL=1